MDWLHMREQVGARAHLRGPASDDFTLQGQIWVRHRDANGQIISDWAMAQNTVMNAWRTEILERAMRTAEVTPTFYFIPIPLAGFTAINAADTLASHTGWTESTDYDEATRQVWTAAAATAQAITNAASPATITVTSGFTCHALAMVSENSTKGNTASGTLVSAAVLAADKPLTAAETLDMIYQYNA